jgi:hypothetical protein
MKSVKKIEFTCELVRERSCTPTVERLGTFNSTMELFTPTGTIEKGAPGEGSIEWNAEPVNDDGEGENTGIGVWWNEQLELIDYDGVFELPKEAIKFLEDLGINCEYAKE